MEIRNLIRINYTGDCFYLENSKSHSCLEELYNLKKTNLSDFEFALSANGLFENSEKIIFNGDDSNVEIIGLSWDIMSCFLTAVRRSKLKLKYYYKMKNRPKGSDFFALLNASRQLPPIRFCVIKINNCLDFDYMFLFTTNADYKECIKCHIEELKSRHPRKYKNLTYKIQFDKGLI